jgi:hypothetical protein
MTAKTLLLVTAIFTIATCSSYASTKLISTTYSKEGGIADWLSIQPTKNPLKLQTPTLVAPCVGRNCTGDPDRTSIEA